MNEELMKFACYNPVRVFFGAGELARAGSEAVKIGSRAALVSYKDHAAIEEVLQTVQEQLHREGVGCLPLFEVSPNPEVGEVERIVESCRSHGVDFIIGVGGGSVMDAAKIAAAGYHYDGPIWNMLISRQDVAADIPPQRALPLMLIPTLPATSSEMNCGAVLSNRNTKVKAYIFNELLYARVAIVDPVLTLGLPHYLTACGAIDAISHNFEPYFNGEGDTPLQWGLEEAAVRAIIDLLPRLLRQPDNLGLRANLQWTILVSHNGWLKTGVRYFSSMHMLAHPLTTRFGINHGASMAIVIPAWMRHVYKGRPDKFVGFAERLFGIGSVGKERTEIALEGIERLEAFFNSVGVPTRLTRTPGLDKADVDIDLLVDDVVQASFQADRTLHGNPPLSKQDVHSLYGLAL